MELNNEAKVRRRWISARHGTSPRDFAFPTNRWKDWDVTELGTWLDEPATASPAQETAGAHESEQKGEQASE
jgi:hypothetical protein